MRPEWLKDAVIYQIYPQSFNDSNGDGIGDFQGIIEKLDYLQDLGVNLLWMNPCFDSPFGDAGYDVSDYMKVAPRYGTEEDLIELFDKARQRGMRVILDLVAGHTSIEHEWFKQSAQGPDNEYADRYIWKNRDFDPEKGPTNENYVQNFFWHQPALNYGYAEPEEDWQDPVDAPGPLANRQAMKDIMDYWMSRGASGFRVDMSSSLVKNDKGFKEVSKLWLEMREWFDNHYPDNILVAEWSDPSTSVAAGYHLDFLMHFHCDIYKDFFFNGAGTLPPNKGVKCYFDAAGKGSAWKFMEKYLQQIADVKGKGYASIPTANHDFQRPRCGSRGWEGLKPLWTFIATQAGPPTIYYGDEIGMRFVDGTPGKEGSTFHNIKAPNAGDANGERAGTRTPMQWNKKQNAGFSTAPAEKLYLPIDSDRNRPDVDSQLTDPNSLLNFVKKLLRLRVEHPALGADGDFIFLNPRNIEYPLIYAREMGERRYVVAINPTDSQKAATVDYYGNKLQYLVQENTSAGFSENGLDIEIAPFGFAIFEVV